MAYWLDPHKEGITSILATDYIDLDVPMSRVGSKSKTKNKKPQRGRKPNRFYAQIEY